MVVDDRITNDPDRLIGGSFRQVDRRTCPALRSRRRGGFFLAILVVFVIFLDVTGATSLGLALPALPSSSIDAYQPLREKESKSSLTSHLVPRLVVATRKSTNVVVTSALIIVLELNTTKHAHAWRHWRHSQVSGRTVPSRLGLGGFQ
jgi:hypothetical protein